MITSSRLKALIKVKAKSMNIDANSLLRTVIFEFFLEKLSRSRFMKHVVIKGGFLVSALTKISLRTTMDLDVTIVNHEMDEVHIATMINEILEIHTLDHLSMQLILIETIRDVSDYPGYRATIAVIFDGIKDHIKIDFTTGDIITPSAIEVDYEPILGGEIIQVMSYNLETLLAEKLETILTRGILNTRMRDFYDVYIVTKMRHKDINNEVLKSAILHTMKQRKTFDHVSLRYLDIIEEIKIDDSLIKRWHQYQAIYPYAKEIDWLSIIDAIQTYIII